MSERMCRRWFKQFRVDDLTLNNDERSERPFEFDREDLKTLVENNPVTTVRQFAQELQIFKVYKICSNFNKYVQDRELTKEYREAMEPYAHIIAFARNGSGEYRKQHLFSYFMYTTLLSETESGLPLPEWAKLVFPASLYGAAKTEVDQMYKGPNRILGGGYLMNKILLDCEDIADDDSDSDPEDETKLYMYSGHDMNIAAILCWLNVFQPHLSNYASYLTFELHIVDGEKYLKIMYQNYEYMEPENIMIPNCGFYCPINKFKELFADDLEPEKYC